MNPALGLALAGIFVGSVALALRAGSSRRAAAVGLFGAALSLALLRQLPFAAMLGTLGLGLWRSGHGQASAPRPGQRSEVRTDALAMSLDHDSGAMEGEVLTGAYAGRRLSDLGPAELQALCAELENDAESLSLLLSYLERSGAETAPPPPPDDAAMGEAEAYGVLGLEPGASRDEVRDAYRRLMRRVHPDLGGSSALAAMINAAKERLDPGSLQD